MIPYINKNVNPKNKKTSDCVIRAIAEVTGVPYATVLLDLANLQVQTGYDLSDKRCYEKYLDAKGFMKFKQPRKPDSTKYLVGEIDKVLEGTKMVAQRSILISMAGHLTAVTEGSIKDIWDCRTKTISNYYIKL